MNPNIITQPYEQSINFTILKVVLCISFIYHFGLLIACLSTRYIIISPRILFHCIAEILIFFAIVLKNYKTYIAGLILCLLSNFAGSRIIFIALIFASFKTDEDKIILALLIFTFFQIYAEFIVYAYYYNKFKNYCNSNLPDIVPNPQNINVQPNNGLYYPSQNIGNENIDTPILSSIDNQGIIDINPPLSQNIDEQVVAYVNPQPAQNTDNQGVAYAIPQPE